MGTLVCLNAAGVRTKQLLLTKDALSPDHNLAPGWLWLYLAASMNLNQLQEVITQQQHWCITSHSTAK